jgi:hypothetical protein
MNMYVMLMIMLCDVNACLAPRGVTILISPKILARARAQVNGLVLLSMNVIVFWLNLIRLQVSMNVCILANFSGISDVLINSEGYLQRFYQFYDLQAQCSKKHR